MCPLNLALQLAEEAVHDVPSSECAHILHQSLKSLCPPILLIDPLLQEPEQVVLQVGLSEVVSLLLAGRSALALNHRQLQKAKPFPLLLEVVVLDRVLRELQREEPLPKVRQLDVDFVLDLDELLLLPIDRQPRAGLHHLMQHLPLEPANEVSLDHLLLQHLLLVEESEALQVAQAPGFQVSLMGVLSLELEQAPVALVLNEIPDRQEDQVLGLTVSSIAVAPQLPLRLLCVGSMMSPSSNDLLALAEGAVVGHLLEDQSLSSSQLRIAAPSLDAVSGHLDGLVGLEGAEIVVVGFEHSEDLPLQVQLEGFNRLVEGSVIQIGQWNVARGDQELLADVGRLHRLLDPVMLSDEADEAAHWSYFSDLRSVGLPRSDLASPRSQNVVLGHLDPVIGGDVHLLQLNSP